MVINPVSDPEKKAEHTSSTKSSPNRAGKGISSKFVANVWRNVDRY